ncbi:hypothetical protein [Mixta intestinalis]|uniref:Uncharacterized protein n=1 Tax=Mixta intestinalis TaxID=1615494 RepID=A0A6P1Q167_9GAMM|nr:hypothetical protein [Mixta intestinalis]QHM72151.1 hypothetical protein C7M51_02451 [Mixta intestinalis]
MYLLNKQQLVRISGAGNAAAVGAFSVREFRRRIAGKYCVETDSALQGTGDTVS